MEQTTVKIGQTYNAVCPFTDKELTNDSYKVIYVDFLENKNVWACKLEKVNGIDKGAIVSSIIKNNRLPGYTLDIYSE